VKRALRIVAAVLVVLLLIAGAAFGVSLWMGERKLERQVFVKVVPVPFAKDPSAAQRGAYLYKTRGCVSCHGPDGSGRVMIDGNGMYVRTPNITRGPGSVVAEYTEADWVRAIRHGVSPQGRALLIMPSDLFIDLSDADLAALVAYLRGLPPIAGEKPVMRLPAIFRALYGVGVVRDSSEVIRHDRQALASVQPAESREYGAYAARICMGCHGETLSGGRRPNGPPHGAVPANLTPGEGTVMPRYDTLEKFRAMMRSGKRPDGSEIQMPFDTLSAFNDNDVAAIYAYLAALPPKRIGVD
jgi:cytochrome c553